MRGSVVCEKYVVANEAGKLGTVFNTRQRCVLPIDPGKSPWGSPFSQRGWRKSASGEHGLPRCTNISNKHGGRIMQTLAGKYRFALRTFLGKRPRMSSSPVAVSKCQVVLWPISYGLSTSTGQAARITCFELCKLCRIGRGNGSGTLLSDQQCINGE